MFKYLVSALALFIYSLASAVPVATATAPNGDWIQLDDSACSLPAVVSAMGPVYGPQARNAAAIVDKQPFKACWVIEGDTVAVMFEDGDIGMIPKDAFKNSKIT
jgi:hypothetical protein